VAPGLGIEPRRLVQWCSAFAAMVALERAESSTEPQRVEMLTALAAAACG